VLIVKTKINIIVLTKETSMKNVNLKGVIFILTIACLSYANDGWVSNTIIEQMNFVTAGNLGHQQTGVEIAFKTTSWPTNVTAGSSLESGYYHASINKNVDDYKTLVAILITAKNNNSTVDIWVTDDQSRGTYSGRPSLKIVSVK
jgi:hypothetical protein